MWVHQSDGTKQQLKLKSVASDYWRPDSDVRDVLKANKLGWKVFPRMLRHLLLQDYYVIH